MANTVRITKLLEGPKTAVFHVFLQSDGSSGELTDSVLIDPTTSFSPALPATNAMTIEEIWYQLDGFAALLEFDATTDVGVVTLSSAPGDSHFDFRSFGGIKDFAGSAATGKLQVTTNGFTAATDNGFIIIQVRKN